MEGAADIDPAPYKVELARARATEAFTRTGDLARLLQKKLSICSGVSCSARLARWGTVETVHGHTDSAPHRVELAVACAAETFPAELTIFPQNKLSGA